jgi:hypothetical protein
MADVIEAGRIGDPVFARWIETVRSDDAPEAADQVSRVDNALETISEWMGGKPDIRSRTDAPGAITVFCKWPDGATALIAIGPTSPDARPSLDVAVIGNIGAAYHDGPSEAAE